MPDILPFITLAGSIGVLIYTLLTNRRMDRVERLIIALAARARTTDDDDAAGHRHDTGVPS